MEFTTPVFCGDYFKVVVGETKTTTDVNEIWNLNRFQDINRPKVIGNFNNWKFSARCLDMPIMFPGSTEIKIPVEYLHLRSLIENVVDFECEINPLINQFHLYITSDSGIVNKNETQRVSGCHVDGFQGARIVNKTLINRSYIVSDCLPTVFYPHPFQTNHLKEDVHNFFLDFDRQADEKFAWRPNPNEIVMSNCYSVHRGDFAKETIKRNFVRLSFDVKEFDRLGNTHNPFFDYNWKMVTRDAKKSLV